MQIYLSSDLFLISFRTVCQHEHFPTSTWLALKNIPSSLITSKAFMTQISPKMKGTKLTHHLSFSLPIPWEVMGI